MDSSSNDERPVGNDMNISIRWCAFPARVLRLQQCFTAAVILLVLMIDCGRASAASLALPAECANAAPAVLAGGLAARYPEWRAARREDVKEALNKIEDRDFRRRWLDRHRSDCWSIAAGNFDGTRRRQFAIVLVALIPSVKARLVYAVETAPGRYFMSQLAEESIVPVVSRRGPGIYRDLSPVLDSGKPTRHRVKHDVIDCNYFSGGEVIFYFEHGKLHKLDIDI